MLEVHVVRGRERSVLRRHPWLMSGSVERVSGEAAPGAWCRVRAADGQVLGHGFYSPASQIRVRLLSFGPEPPGDALIERRIAQAVERRRGHPDLADTDAVRLVNAEGDLLPGLVADRFGEVLVVKLTSAGMAARRALVARALERASGARAGLLRADPAAAKREGLQAEDALLFGERPAATCWIREGALRFKVDLESGQKTGFYLDQRDARRLAGQLAAGRSVLDLYAHSGGFAVACAVGQAEAVTLIESSSEALALAEENLAANAPAVPRRLLAADVHRFLREDRGQYSLVVVDPPPLAKSKQDVERAARAYKDALLYALRRAAPDAYVLAFSCSHHVGAELFPKIVFGASLDAGRPLQLLRTLGAPVDHPVSLDHPEGTYLFGLLLRTLPVPG